MAKKQTKAEIDAELLEVALRYDKGKYPTREENGDYDEYWENRQQYQDREQLASAHVAYLKKKAERKAKQNGKQS